MVAYFVLSIALEGEFAVRVVLVEGIYIIRTQEVVCSILNQHILDFLSPGTYLAGVAFSCLSLSALCAGAEVEVGEFGALAPCFQSKTVGFSYIDRTFCDSSSTSSGSTLTVGVANIEKLGCLCIMLVGLRQ